jgi:LacI family transcriptional regulator
VNEEIRAEIQAAAKKHGYRPHANARSLRTGQTHAIGVLLFNVRTAKWVVGPVFFEYLAGITDRLVEQEYKTIVVRDWQLAGDEGNRTPILFRERAMDGLICTHPTTPLLAQFIDKLNVPVIWLDSGHHEERGTVSRDEACATRLAVETLAGLGHRKIVYLDKPGSGPSKPADKAYVVHHSVTERRAAYQAVMGERNLDPKCMVASAYEETIGPLKEMLAQSDRPTACICYSTNEAFWLLSACGAMGLSVPKDLSIIALDDNASIADSWPELGRISFDRYAMGRCAAEMMLERLENKTVVPPSLNFAKHQILGSTFAHPSS